MSNPALSATDYRQTLLQWGFPVATFLQDDLTLNEMNYVSFLKAN